MRIVKKPRTYAHLVKGRLVHEHNAAVRRLQAAIKDEARLAKALKQAGAEPSKVEALRRA